MLLLRLKLKILIQSLKKTEETVKAAIQPAPQATAEAVVTPIASSQLNVSVDDIDVAHPTE